MRTTLTLDDDVFEIVSRQAQLRGLSLGKTVSDLIRKGLRVQTPCRQQDGVTMFDLPPDSPEVTMESVRRLEAEGG